MLAGEGGDANAVLVGLPYLVEDAELCDAGTAPGSLAVRSGGCQAFAGRFVLQVRWNWPTETKTLTSIVVVASVAARSAMPDRVPGRAGAAGRR